MTETVSTMDQEQIKALVEACVQKRVKRLKGLVIALHTIIAAVLTAAGYFGLPQLLKSMASDTAVSLAIDEFSKATNWDKILAQTQKKLALVEETYARIQKLLREMGDADRYCVTTAVDRGNYRIDEEVANEISWELADSLVSSSETTDGKTEGALRRATLYNLRSIASNSGRYLTNWVFPVRQNEDLPENVSLHLLNCMAFGTDGEYVPCSETILYLKRKKTCLISVISKRKIRNLSVTPILIFPLRQEGQKK